MSALMLSLIFNELSTNAAKYGALSSPTGRVEIETSMREGDLGPVVVILWRESGGPLVVKTTRWSNAENPNRCFASKRSSGDPAMAGLRSHCGRPLVRFNRRLLSHLLP
jgi:hypothetical protein